MAEDFDGWAEYYDMIHADHDEDMEFYLEESLETEGKVLEIGCGTGRIYLEMLENGVEAKGIDISGAMLEKLREKADERGLEPEVKVADMTDFEFDEKFSLIIIPFRTFLHNLTVEDQIAVLRNIQEHLEEGGRLILNFYVPDPERLAYDTGGTQEIEAGGEVYVRETEVEWEDKVEMVRKVENRLYGPGDELVWESEFRTRIVTRADFELLLRLTGFSDWKVYGGFDLQELESADQEMVWIVEN